MHMKFTEEMHQFQTTSSTCSCLLSFLLNKIKNLSSWMSDECSQKGGRLRWSSRKEFKMEVYHDRSPDMRLQGCAGSLVHS